MGIRHVSGAKKWHGWQSAKLVNSMYENGHSLAEIGEMLGITSIDAGRRMRGYKAFQQLENDPDFGQQKETHHYALLLEFLSSNKQGKEWLGWDEKNKAFTNQSNLKRVYKAIVKDDNGEYEIRNIDDARAFLKVIDTESGQQQVINTKNFREVKVDQTDKCSDYQTIIKLLESKMNIEKGETDNEYLLQISKLVNVLMGGA